MKLLCERNCGTSLVHRYDASQNVIVTKMDVEKTTLLIAAVSFTSSQIYIYKKKTPDEGKLKPKH